LWVEGKAWVSSWEAVLMVVKICFQQSAQVGMGHRFSEALSCILLGPAFYFLAKILPLGDVKNREGLPPLYRGFLGKKKPPRISPHF
jgi:hypothetical protein